MLFGAIAAELQAIVRFIRGVVQMICHVNSKSYGFIDRNDIASAVGRRNGAKTAGDDTGRALDVQPSSTRPASASRRRSSTFVAQGESVVVDLAADPSTHANHAAGRHLGGRAGIVRLLHARRRGFDSIPIRPRASAANSRIPLVGVGLPSRSEGRMRV